MEQIPASDHSARPMNAPWGQSLENVIRRTMPCALRQIPAQALCSEWFGPSRSSRFTPGRMQLL